MTARLRDLLSNATVRRYAPAAAICVAALVVFSIDNDFRLGLHSDEVRKVRVVTRGEFYFFHPLLMVETTRLAASLLGVSAPQAVAELGRALTAVVGAIGVTALFLLMRRRVGEWIAIVLSLAAMTTPLLAIHAHYLKEDAWLFAFCAVAMLAFSRLVDEQKASNTVLLGLGLGLAISSKAVGAFLIPVFALTALLQPGTARRRLLAGVALASVTAVAVVVLVNFRMLLNLQRAWADLAHEFQHGVAGNWDGVAYPLWFHLTHSLWPGVGPALLALGLIGLAVCLLRWRRPDPIDLAMALYAAIYYGLIEASPLKGGADMIRYAVPLVLPLAYFAGIAVARAAAWLADRRPAWLPAAPVLALHAVVAVALIPTAVTGLRLVAALPEDTRIVADRVLAGKGSQVVTEALGTSVFSLRVASLAMLDLPRVPDDFRYLVASSFLYDRFAIGAATGGPRNAGAEKTWARYQVLFQFPYCEIRPRVMSYGFSNPVIRIVDLRGARRIGATSSPYDTSLGAACAAGP